MFVLPERALSACVWFSGNDPLRAWGGRGHAAERLRSWRRAPLLVMLGRCCGQRTRNGGYCPHPPWGDLAGVQILEYGFCWGWRGGAVWPGSCMPASAHLGGVGLAPGDGGHVAAMRVQEGTVPTC